MRVSLLVLSLLGVTAAAAQPVPGTRATLQPPVGYEPSERFAGFEHVALGASLMVMELPGAPLAELFAAFTPEALAAQGVLEARLDTVQVGGQMAALVTGWQRAYGVSFDKWSLVTGDSAGVVMVTASLPQDAASGAADALVASLYTLTLGEASGDLFDGLPFTLAVPDALPERLQMGSGLLLAETYGEDSPPGSPYYIISLGAAPLMGDLEAAAERRILQTPTLDGFGEVATRPLAVGGREGAEALVSASDDGERITTVLVLVPNGETGYVIVQAMVGADRADEWLPRFRAMTESIVWDE